MLRTVPCLECVGKAEAAPVSRHRDMWETETSNGFLITQGNLTLFICLLEGPSLCRVHTSSCAHTCVCTVAMHMCTDTKVGSIPR